MGILDQLQEMGSDFPRQNAHILTAVHESTTSVGKRQEQAMVGNMKLLSRTTRL